VTNKTKRFQLSFDPALKTDFPGSRVACDKGLTVNREVHERRGFGKLIEQHLSHSRRGENTQCGLANLFRRSVYSPLSG